MLLIQISTFKEDPARFHKFVQLASSLYMIISRTCASNPENEGKMRGYDP